MSDIELEEKYDSLDDAIRSIFGNSVELVGDSNLDAIAAYVDEHGAILLPELDPAPPVPPIPLHEADEVTQALMRAFDRKRRRYLQERQAKTQATVTKDLLPLKSVSQLVSEAPQLEYIIELILPLAYNSIVTAPKGNFKSTFLAYLAVMVASGTALSPELPILKRGPVVIMAGENVRDVQAQVVATVQYHDLPPSTLDLIQVIPASMALDEHIGQLKKTLVHHNVKPVLFGIDTAQAYAPSGDVNNPSVMKQFADAATTIKHGTGAHVMTLAHPTKSDGKAKPHFMEPSGGESLVNASDGLATAIAANGTQLGMILRKNPKWREGDWSEIHFNIDLVTDCEAATYMGLDPDTGQRVKKYRPVPVISGVKLFKQHEPTDVDDPAQNNFRDSIARNHWTVLDHLWSFHMDNGRYPTQDELADTCVSSWSGDIPDYQKKKNIKRTFTAMMKKAPPLLELDGSNVVFGDGIAKKMSDTVSLPNEEEKIIQ